MTNSELKSYMLTVIPSEKDLMRAQDVVDKAYAACRTTDARDSKMSILANKQLKAITDMRKFFGRARAFMQKGILISFQDTMFANNEVPDIYHLA